MSWWNAAIVVGALLGAVVVAVQQKWVSAIVLALAAAAVAASAVYARSGAASDITRLNAAEYIDERDRSIAARAFAVVGVAALVLSLGVFVLAAAISGPDEPFYWVGLGQVVVLTVVWGVANVVTVRRS